MTLHKVISKCSLILEVQSILLKENAHIIVVGCTYHSFNLCYSYACQKLSKGVEVLVKDHRMPIVLKE